MKISLFFMHTAPGRGELRAVVYRENFRPDVFTVGSYHRNPLERTWTARMFKVPGDPAQVTSTLTSPTVSGLRKLVTWKARGGAWWQ